jgi:hypothetical protein
MKYINKVKTLKNANKLYSMNTKEKRLVSKGKVATQK